MVDIVRASRKTLQSLDFGQTLPTFTEPMLRALLPTTVDDTDLCIQTSMQEIRFQLEDSTTVSALMQRALTSLQNLTIFRQYIPGDENRDWRSGRLEIRDTVARWACVGLRSLSIYLGCSTVYRMRPNRSDGKRSARCTGSWAS